MKFSNKLSTTLILILMMFQIGCSLNYEDEEAKISNAPEFTFKNVKFSRYEKNKLKMQLNAEQLEQYRDDNSTYAKNTKFFTWNEKNEIETEGKCYLLAVNTKAEIYSMFTDILIKNYESQVELKAQNLKWNGKTEQLISSSNETVFLKKDKVELEGKGFSASGVSKSFSFTGDVKGTLITENTETDILEEESNEVE